MSRRFISVALGMALVASSSLSAGAATSATQLANELTTGNASPAVVAAAGAVGSACAAGSSGAACLAALQALLAALPPTLSASLRASAFELVRTTVASRPDIAANPALGAQLASLSSTLSSLGGGTLTGSTTPTPGDGPASGGGAG